MVTSGIVRNRTGSGCSLHVIPSRRHFLAVLGGVAACSLLSGRRTPALSFPGSNSKFKLSVITDEITQDLGHALEIASQEFGLGFVELRSLWNKNIINLDEKETTEARKLLQKYALQVTDIASPLFKTDLLGAPKSKYSPATPQFGADYPFEKQGEVLERAITVAKALGTDRIRCFDFWRLEAQETYRGTINDLLRKTAEDAAKEKMTLLLENEGSCNTATAAEAAHTLQAVQSPNFLLNWDPGNAASRGEIAYPDGFQKIPIARIGHMHCKDVVRKPDGSYDWAAMGRGIIDYVGQFRALLRAGYRGTVSLETHWSGAGSPEESSRQSFAGMKKQLSKAGAL